MVRTRLRAGHQTPNPLILNQTQGFNFSDDIEEGQMEDNVPMYEIGSRYDFLKSKPKLSRRELEAIRAKEGPFAEHFSALLDRIAT